VYHKVREDLEKLGVIFTDMDTALREYPDLIKSTLARLFRHPTISSPR